MESINLKTFVEGYIADPEYANTVFPFLINSRRSKVSPDEYTAALKRAKRAYRDFDYVKTIIELDSIVRDWSENPLKKPKTLLSGGKELEKAVLARDVLTLLEKSAAWLGMRSLNTKAGRGSSCPILDDIEQLDGVLGWESAADTSRAFRLQVAGDYSASMYVISKGLHNLREKGNKRFIMDAKARLAFRLKFFEEAAALYKQVIRLDDEVTMSEESRALGMGFYGIACLNSEGRRQSMIDEVEYALNICSRVGHYGFAFQMEQELVQHCIDTGDFEAAQEVVSKALKHDTSVGHSGRYSALQYFTTYVSALKRDGQGSSSGKKYLMERNPGLRLVLVRGDENLRLVADRALEALLRRNTLEAQVWTSVLCESVTDMLARSYGMNGRGNPLYRKNVWLFKA